MTSFLFKPLDLVSILSFLHNFKSASDSNAIHEGAAMWVFPYFMKNPAKAAPSYLLRASEDNTTQKAER